MRKIAFYLAGIYAVSIPYVCFAEDNESLDVVKKVEENLIYSKEVAKPEDVGDIVIKKGGWNSQDTTVLEDITANKGKTAISSEVKETKEDNTTSKEKDEETVEEKSLMLLALINMKLLCKFIKMY